jgi:hypothetical protein
MQSLTVIKTSNYSNTACRLITVLISLLVYKLGFQVLEEAF